MRKDISYYDSDFTHTKELLLSNKTRVIESVTGHKTLDVGFDNGMRSLGDYLIYYTTRGEINGFLAFSENTRYCSM